MLIARQAIFNHNMSVYGYELLFRSDYQSSQYDGYSSVQATATVLEGLYENGLNKIVEDKLAFLNCDADFILSDTLEIISPNRLVIEVLEDVEATDELLRNIEYLKNKGYRIALDDFTRSLTTYPIVPFADIIKFDLMATPLDTIKPEIALALSQNKILLAEKIETKEEFKKAKSMGFQLFQGFFFSKPSIVGKSNSNTAKRTHFTSLISELRKEEPSYQRLAEIIQTDANLTYRLLSVSSKRAGKDSLYSIKRALLYMGFREIELWINIMMMRDISNHKPRELMKLALIRSRFAEAIATHSRFSAHRQEASLLGLLSTMDAMLDQSFETALQDISIPPSITDCLIKNEGFMIPLYQLILYYEKGNFEMAELLAVEIKISTDTLGEDYLNAVSWAMNILNSI